jgi:AcrR family transcriptional regulator
MPRHPFTDTRERIERAAVQLFVQRGIAETTVRDIARAVGLSEGALYRHFVGKDELVWRIFEKHYLEFATRLAALAEAQATTRDKVAAMIQGFCDAHDDTPEIFRFLLFVQHGQLERLGQDAVTPVDVVKDVIRHGIEVHELPEQDLELATSLVFGIVLQPTQFAAYGRLRTSMRAICPRLVNAAWAALTVH